VLDKILRWAFFGALILSAFAAGAAVVEFKLFPYYQARSIAAQTYMAFHNRGSYLGTEPSRWLRPALNPGNGVTRMNESKMQPGLTFMTSLFDEAVALQLVEPDGNVRHRWIDTESWDTREIHGAWALPDGSVVFSRSDVGLRRFDKCGRELWHVKESTHHSVFYSADDRTFWVSSRRVLKEGDKGLSFLPGIRPPFTEDLALEISPEGEVLREISIPRVIFEADLAGLLYATGRDGIGNLENELTHLNDVEVLQQADTDAFPMFEAGDIMVSLRNNNLILIFDPESGDVKWYESGPWVRQHDPQFRADGLITVFDNRKDDTRTGSILGGSRILAIDPLTRKVTILYQDNEENPFYSNVLGKQQTLDNGNILISSGHEGRILEVTKDGEIVWEFINRYDETRAIMLHQGIRYSEGYFTVDDWSCG